MCIVLCYYFHSLFLSCRVHTKHSHCAERLKQQRRYSRTESLCPLYCVPIPIRYSSHAGCRRAASMSIRISEQSQHARV